MKTSKQAVTYALAILPVPILLASFYACVYFMVGSWVWIPFGIAGIGGGTIHIIFSVLLWLKQPEVRFPACIGALLFGATAIIVNLIIRALYHNLNPGIFEYPLFGVFFVAGGAGVIGAFIIGTCWWGFCGGLLTAAIGKVFQKTSRTTMSVIVCILCIFYWLTTFLTPQNICLGY